MKLVNKYKIEGKLKVETGMHIGGMKETFQIGGSDSPVIKTKNGIPYIPGSSLKGKIRSLLEKGYGKQEICDCGTCNICILFGCHSSKNSKRSGVLIFRDSNTSEDDSKKLLETKAENVIDRVKGTTTQGGLRFIERVVPDTVFDVEIIYNKFDSDNDKGLLETLRKGFELLENDYLGGSGTRGYGKVDVSEIIKKINSFISQMQ